MFKLRPLTVDDKDLLLSWRNSERVRRHMYSDHLITQDEHDAWFAKTLQEPYQMIFALADQPIGFVSFSKINLAHSRCTWGCYIGDERVPIYSGAVFEVMIFDYAFQEIGIRRLHGEVLESNAAVLNLHKRFGLLHEGILSGHVCRGGSYIDVHLFAIHKDQWAARRERHIQLMPKAIKSSLLIYKPIHD